MGFGKWLPTPQEYQMATEYSHELCALPEHFEAGACLFG